LIGVNSRLDELQAAFLRVKLRDLNKINNHKRDLANLYHCNINQKFIKPALNNDFYDVYHIYNIRHKKREVLKDFLLKNGVKTEIHYPVPPHKQQALGFLKESKFPISEEIHKTTLSLPISASLSKKEILQVIELINNFK
jgi:dTDP-4-amino-4,6-dideoxygalactose transaminase